VGSGPDGLEDAAGDGVAPRLLGEHLVRHLLHQAPLGPRALSPYVAHDGGACSQGVLHRAGWKTCGEWWILTAVRPEEIVGAPGARVLYSTPSGRAVFRGPRRPDTPSR